MGTGNELKRDELLDAIQKAYNGKEFSIIDTLRHTREVIETIEVAGVEVSAHYLIPTRWLSEHSHQEEYPICGDEEVAGVSVKGTYDFGQAFQALPSAKEALENKMNSLKERENSLDRVIIKDVYCGDGVYKKVLEGEPHNLMINSGSGEYKSKFINEVCDVIRIVAEANEEFSEDVMTAVFLANESLS